MADQKPKEEQKPLSIYQAIPKITGEVAPIAKDRKNPQQGYNFRGIDDVYAALNLLLAKYGVSVFPKILDSQHDMFETKNGAKMFRHRLKIQYKLTASDGTSELAESEGEGMDTGDKATPKAFSTAYKTMAFQLFCIPTGEKIDSENDSPEVVAPTAAKPPPAQQTAPKSAPQTDAASEALVEEHRQALAQAKDEDTIKRIGAAILAQHKAHQINDTQKNVLKKLADGRRLDLGIAGNGVVVA